jgi:NAD(P)-dependent dehydrogenase (short-subunit alcohol dehydrogenase family)
MPNLAGKVAIVTGAGRGIGRAHALALAEAGAHVVVNDLGAALSGEGHDDTPAQQVVEEIKAAGGEAAANAENVADFDGAERMVKQAIDQFGRLDILVNNASNFLHTEFATTTEESWDASLDVNLKAPFFCSQAAGPLLKKNHGVIINLSDVAGLLGWTGYIPHCVSKAGVIMLTRILARELAPDVRVNAIAPGTITMPGDAPELEADYIKRAPSRRAGSTADVTAAISFLLNSPFITGQVLVLDGGRAL